MVNKWKMRKEISHFLLLPPPSSFSFLHRDQGLPHLLDPNTKLSSSLRKVNLERTPTRPILSKQEKQEEVQEEEAISFLGS